jgi:hypothetical protein
MQNYDKKREQGRAAAPMTAGLLALTSFECIEYRFLLRSCPVWGLLARGTGMESPQPRQQCIDIICGVAICRGEDLQRGPDPNTTGS